MSKVDTLVELLCRESHIAPGQYTDESGMTQPPPQHQHVDAPHPRFETHIAKKEEPSEVRNLPRNMNLDEESPGDRVENL